jgi:spoIIIJ-associated protein
VSSDQTTDDVTEATQAPATQAPEPTDETTAVDGAVDGEGDGAVDGAADSVVDGAARADEPAGDTVAEGDTGDTGDTEDVEPDETERLAQLEREGDIAADYLEELLDIADLDGDLDMDVEGDRASVSIVGGDLDRLVGRNGEVLDALQELTRLAVLRETGERSRLMLDIGGHRAERRKVLEGLARDAVEEAKASGQPVPLKPMTPFERKVVHDVVADAGLASDSEGTEPRRFVVVRPS